MACAQDGCDDTEWAEDLCWPHHYRASNPPPRWPNALAPTQVDRSAIRRLLVAEGTDPVYADLLAVLAGYDHPGAIEQAVFIAGGRRG